ncbi:MAG: PEP-CTERM sorting domain-containing protein [Phycisphaeraceae bacterium]|nr:PEP-CTERM sorting domain-containing protein [Phycisphaeraceae bacterium]
MTHHQRYLCLAAIFAFAVSVAGPSLAVPIQGQYQDDPLGCDTHGPQFLSHELGDAAVFPNNEAFLSTFVNTSNPAYFTCDPDDGAPNDFIVRITNISGIDYRNLYFVVDAGVDVGNHDGHIQDLTAPGFHKAYRIDGTVTPGLNNPLLSESINANEIFEAGETWDFVVINLVSPANLPPFPFFGSVGKFSVSSSVTVDSNSNASILADPVPEPATLGLLGLSALLLLKRESQP